MRRPAVQVPQQGSGGNHKLQVLDVRVGLGNGGMVVEHQQDAGDQLDGKRAQRQRPQIPSVAKCELSLAHPGGEDFFDLSLPPLQGKDRVPQDVVVRQSWYIGHGYVRTYWLCAGIMVARSINRLPSSFTHIFSQGRGRGAGPAITAPFRLKALPWQGQAMMPASD